MFSPRRALILAVSILCCIYLFYPRGSDTTLKPLKPPTPVTSSKTLTPEQQSQAIVAESKPQSAPVVRGSSQAQQRLTIDKLQNLSLREQLEYQFPYVVESKFPAFIWQTWKYTPASKKFEHKFRGMEASWTEKHPMFVHEVGTLNWLRILV